MTTIRAFNNQDQQAFAELSGDYNPLHVDPAAARRLLFGQPVVHGIHLVLWALECWCISKCSRMDLRVLRADFRRPAGVGEPVHYILKKDQPGRTTLNLLVGDSLAARVDFEWESAADQNARVQIRPRSPVKQVCRQWPEGTIQDAAGRLEISLDVEAAGRLFPQAAQLFSPLQLAEILATTRLVGVECPGLNSVYSQVALSFTEGGDQPEQADLCYSVAMFDSRFNLVVMNVAAPGMSGTVRAFASPPPCQQLRYEDALRVTSPGEFAGQRALVVGGSRGLGEVTAKLLAAGGANVTITYFRGADDARRVVREIRANGGAASELAFDVLGLDDWFHASPEAQPTTDLYYFATPAISPGNRNAFSADRFENYCRYYLTGFARLFDQLARQGLSCAFYPSSVYVESPPENLREYAAAKTAAEGLCAFLEIAYPGVSIYRPRLPRMATDQTASLTPVENADPAPVMLEQLRLVQRKSEHQASEPHPTEENRPFRGEASTSESKE